MMSLISKEFVPNIFTSLRRKKIKINTLLSIIKILIDIFNEIIIVNIIVLILHQFLFFWF